MLELRDAVYSDYPAIAKIHADNWRQYYRGIYSDDFLDNLVKQERLGVWQQRLSKIEEGQKITVAIADGIVAGFSCLYIDEDQFFGSYLDNLHVSADHQKSGIGKQLLHECAGRIIGTASTRKLYLWVYEANQGARRVYEHLGAVHFETCIKQTKDGKTARTCRYCWTDVGLLI
jgi:ribosomal protein S18 acetylase RimI-like enzyme